MNIKPTLFLSCFVAISLTSTGLMANPHRGGGYFGNMPRRGGGARPLAFNGMRGWNGRHWNGHYWNGNHWSNNWNWHHHHHFNNAFFLDFGFPFLGWWGYPWTYGYYPYGYQYGYFGYGNGYYGNPGYGYGSGNGYDNGSNVSDLQRKLADAGYYHGPIDGIMGSRTRSALQAYRRDNSNGHNTNGPYSPTLRDRPYSPPPVTTEPSPGE